MRNRVPFVFEGSHAEAGKADRIMARKAPEIIELNSQRIEELLQRAESNTLRGDDTELMRQILTSYQDFFQIVGDKNTTIARLRKMMFGAANEKSKNVLVDAAAEDGDVAGETSGDGESDFQSDETAPRTTAFPHRTT